MARANADLESLNVTQLQPVAFRKNAWDRLVLDPQYKDIVQAMVSSYVEKSSKLDDLVAGKGAGLVALLHGPPGTGKTLTAGKFILLVLLCGYTSGCSLVLVFRMRSRQLRKAIVSSYVR